MKLHLLKLSLLVMTGLAWFATAAPAAASNCTPIHAEASNRDGSRLRLQAQCPPVQEHDDDEDGQGFFASIEVAYAAPDATVFGPAQQLDGNDDDEPHDDARLIDLDRDGFFEVEARGTCGAGPNCAGDLYRLDPATGRLSHFFSGGYSALTVLDGYLIEAGRASCCSWEYHAWRMDGPARLRDYDNMDLMVTIGATDDERNPCTFMRRNGDNWQVVAPPGKAWLSLCRMYGDDYHLVPPEQQAQATAAAAAQEQ